MRYGICYIDSKPGMALAQRFGVMDVGLPSALLFGSPDTAEHEFVVQGQPVPRKQLVGNLKRALAGLEKNTDGTYVHLTGGRCRGQCTIRAGILVLELSLEFPCGASEHVAVAAAVTSAAACRLVRRSALASLPCVSQYHACRISPCRYQKKTAAARSEL